MMKFKVLGPLDVEGASAGKPLSAAMPRKVLAVLLLNHNQPVTISSLVDELWSAQPPRLAKKTVQTYIYQLRGHLDPPAAPQSRIESHPGRYMVRLAPGDLDWADAQDLFRQGREALRSRQTDEAFTLLRRGLDLWRGPTLADVETGPLLEAQITHIESVRLGIHEEVIDIGLRLGHYHEAVPELRQLVAANPLHEGFHGQLMTALAGTGDRTGALEIYTGLRERMVRVLGLEPSARVEGIQQGLIQGTLDLRTTPRPESAQIMAPPARTAPAQLPPLAADFVGRSQELRRITDPQDHLLLPRVTVIKGAAGVGKTSLAVRAGHRLRANYPDGQLFAELGATTQPITVLDSFLRSTGAPSDVLSGGAGDKVSYFRSWTSGQRVMVVLDDVTSLETVHPLLPAGDNCLTIITSQVGIPGLAGASFLVLDGLLEQDGVKLLEHIVGRERVQGEMRAARDLVALCDHLPLAIRAAAEKLAARPSWSIEYLVTRMSDPDRRLQELVTRGLDPGRSIERARDRLAPAYRWALSRLAALGPRDFSLEEAAKALDTDPVTAECPVAELLDAHLLHLSSRWGGNPATFRFSDLVRLHVLAHAHPHESPPSRRPLDVRQWTEESVEWAS